MPLDQINIKWYFGHCTKLVVAFAKCQRKKKK